jgi:hypothetical protein
MDPKEAARLIGNIGGLKRKAQKPNYSELGKRGAKKRWDKKRLEEANDQKKVV